MTGRFCCRQFSCHLTTQHDDTNVFSLRLAALRLGAGSQRADESGDTIIFWSPVFWSQLVREGRVAVRYWQGAIDPSLNRGLAMVGLPRIGPLGILLLAGLARRAPRPSIRSTTLARSGRSSRGIVMRAMDPMRRNARPICGSMFAIAPSPFAMAIGRSLRAIRS